MSNPLDLSVYCTHVPVQERIRLEDDGVSLRYQKGEVACTPIVCRREGDQVVVEIGPVTGNYRGQPERRGYTLVLRGAGGTQTIPLPAASLREQQSIRIEFPG